MSATSVIALARPVFERGDRVEMGVLAELAGVNRATLYRWIGSRDTLLAELVWERMERGLRHGERRAQASGGEGTGRLAALLGGLFGTPDDGSPVRSFVVAEPATAMRVMTTGTVHERLIAWFARAVEEETTAGRIAPRYPAAQIAELVVKTGEAVFWFDVASGRGLDRANMDVLLHALCSPTDG